jgi:alpha-glucosidase (family GH31 glycosyl hydrolase)
MVLLRRACVLRNQRLVHVWPMYLAAPVLDQGATTRTLYLPANEDGWTHHYSRKTYVGGANVTVPAPYDELPLFERENVGL